MDFLPCEKQQESRYVSDFTEHQIQKEKSNEKCNHNENGHNNNQNQQSKPTVIKEAITIDTNEIISGTDNKKDMPTFEGNKKYETTYDEKARKDRKKENSNPTNKQDQNKKQRHQTDHSFSPRDGEQTTGSGNQNKDDQNSGGGKKDKKTDVNDKNRSHSSVFESLKNEFKKEAKDLSQTVISTLISEIICSIIDEVMEKGFQNIDFSKDIQNSILNSMKSLLYGCLTVVARMLVKLFGTKVPQAKYLANFGGPLLNVETLFDFAFIFKRLFDGKLTLSEAVIQICVKAVFIGIRLLIASYFGTVGYATQILINIAMAVIQHSVNCFIKSLCVI